MQKTVAEIIRDIRKAKKLTQKEFADKFYVTDKTISNYERGIRVPSIEFLDKIADTFEEPLNCSLDMFFPNREESKPRDLVVARRNGKCAIFDTSNSAFLTPHSYDVICISKYGYHIAYNLKEIIDVDEKGEEYKSEEIAESFLIDNFGNIRHFKDLVFGFNGYFDIFGFCPAYSPKDRGIVLVDFDGKKFSKPYRRIFPFTRYESNINLGLYYGVKNFETEDYVVLDKHGEIDLGLNGGVGNEAVLKDIEKYGPNILELFYGSMDGLGGRFNLVDDFTLNKLSDCIDVLNAVSKFIDNNFDIINYL